MCCRDSAEMRERWGGGGGEVEVDESGALIACKTWFFMVSMRFFVDIRCVRGLNYGPSRSHIAARMLVVCFRSGIVRRYIIRNSKAKNTYLKVQRRSNLQRIEETQSPPKNVNP